MRRVSRGALGAVVILLAAAHVAYWYWPREHPAVAREGSLTVGLLQSAELPLRAWVAYPHQNLAFLAGAESGENWRRGLSELLGVPQIELPRFGPFKLPPARSLAVAADAEGERLVVVARIYPAIAWIARAAGTLARNPWLTGGVVGEAGRRLEVAWDRGHWMLRTPGEAWPRAAEGGPPGPALARLSLDRPLGALPAADYRLVRTGPHLDLLTDGASPDGLVEPGRGALIHTERSPAGWRATAVLGPGQGSLQGLPSSVGFARPGVDPPKLPFERLYRLLGIDRRREEHDGWRLVASDRLALERGRALAAEVGRLSEGGARQRFVVDLDVVREVTRELEAGLEGLPLRSIPEVRRWHGASLLLYELGAYDRWSLEVGEDGSTVRSRLWRPE